MTEAVFEIRISPEGRRYRIAASAPTRKSPPREKEEVVAPIKNINEDILQLQDALQRGSASRRSPTAIQIGTGADKKITQELGNKLFDFLFPKGIAEFFRQNLAEVDKEILRIRLIIDEDVSELSTIPWEAVYDKEKRSFLATEQRALFTRAVRNLDTLMKPRERLNILGMIANPTEFRGLPLDAINVAAEKRNLEEALRPLAGKANLTWTTSGTYRELRRHLLVDEREGSWSVFHYIGHGDFDESEHKGFLILEEDGGSKGEAHYSEELRHLLTAARAPQLVVLNTCNSARSASGDLFSSTAGDLVIGGVPAVVAMQFPVSDGMAIAFANVFYNGLADGLAIHQAMADFRAQLKGRGFAEWITPVLYLQSDDGTFYRSSAS